MLITGDDLLIEYIERLIDVIQENTGGDELKNENWKFKIEGFITHYVWRAQDTLNAEKKSKKQAN